MKKNRTAKIVLYILVGAFVIAHFFQPEKNKGQAYGSQDITRAVTVPADVQKLLEKSCYDCHSNNTNYVWYDHIFPVNWWVKDHIEDGKNELNFTLFATYSEKKRNKKLHDIAEEVEEGQMPLKSYTFMHTDTKLSDAEKQKIISWAKTQQTAAGTEEESNENE